MSKTNEELIQAFNTAKELLGINGFVNEIVGVAFEAGLLTKEEHDGIKKISIYNFWPKS